MKKHYKLLILFVLIFVAGCSETDIPEPVTLNFDPEQYEGVAGWDGKTVLLEQFTGSECPPCAASNLAIEGLMKSFDRKYLAVIEYHLPIPGPDPMMTRAAHFRSFHYDAFRAPMTFFDGEEKYRGGGPAEKAEVMYKQYYSEITERLRQKAEVNITVSANLVGDNINVAGLTDTSSTDFEYNFVLVQKEIAYQGRNRIPLHTMVARQHKTVETDMGGTISLEFNIPEVLEELTKWLDNVERNYAPYKFTERLDSIDKDGLAVVMFVQHKTSGQILDAAVADVKTVSD